MNNLQLTANFIGESQKALRSESDFSTAISGLEQKGFNLADMIAAIVSGAKFVYHAASAGESFFELLSRLWNAIFVPQPARNVQPIPARVYLSQRQKVLVPRYRNA